MQPGQLVGSRFELEAPAGTGGMATVWRARDTLRGVPVALKLLDQRGEREARRFAREAEVLQSIEHPGVVAHVAHGESTGDGAWIAMDWVEGTPLDQLLDRGPIPVPESVALVRRIADAAGSAHRRGVVHRDIKPANVVLRGGGLDRPVLIDFGLARTRSPGRFTNPGIILGTPGYMAPEQIRRGQDSPAPGPPADVFALGCLLYECTTGEHPFEGHGALATMAKTLLEDPTPLAELRADIPWDLSDLVMRMLDRDPGLRPRHGDAVAEALGDLVSIGRVRPSAPPRPVPPQSVRPGTRERRLVSIVVTAPLPPTSGDTLDLPLDLGALTELLDVRTESLPDGALLLTLESGEGAAADLASRAAMCALSLLPHVTGGGVVLTTGRAEVEARRPYSEAIDRAATLLKQSPLPDAVRIDELTAGLLPTRFVLSGDAAGLSLHGEREQLDQARLLLGKPVPCIGREVERALLDASFERCVDTPAAKAVLLCGDAGTGKSRLRHELLLRLTTEDRPLAVWVARGDPVRVGAPFGLLAAGLRGVFGIGGGDTPTVRQKRVRARVSRHVREGDVQRVSEFVGEIVGAPFDAGQSLQLSAARQSAELMRDQVRRALLDLIGAECAVHPLVLVFEDLHWGDAPSVMLLDEALRRFADRPLLVLAVARPEVRTLFPDLWAEHDLLPIEVGPLPEGDAHALVHEALGEGLSEERLRALVEAAAGNAFFLEELIRAEAEGGAGEVPATVLATLASRIQGMAPEARRVLRMASIFGSSFTADAVCALHEEPTVARRWLERLAEQEALTDRGDLRGRREYTFRHALLREAAYATWTLEERAHTHRRAAEWLETSGEATSVELAEHWREGREPHRASHWLAKAAEAALEGSDLVGAIRLADAGLALDPSPETAGLLYLARCEARRWQGTVDEAQPDARRAHSLLAAGTPGWAAATAEMSVIASQKRGNQPDVGIAIRALLPHCGTDDTLFAQSIVRVALASLYVDSEPGRDDLMAAVNRATERWSKDPLVAPYFHSFRGAHALMSGDLGAFIRERTAAARAFEATGDVRRTIANDGMVGYGHLSAGAYEEAERVLTGVVQGTRALGLWYVEAVALHNLGLALARLGRWDEGRSAEDRAVQMLSEHGHPWMAAAARIYRVRIALEEGAMDDAERELAPLKAMLDGASEHLMARTAAAEATVCLSRGDTTGAVQRARAAMSLLQTATEREGWAFVMATAAEVLLAAGEKMEATSVLDEALATLMRQVETLDGEDARATMLTRVPEHARIVALAGELRG